MNRRDFLLSLAASGATIVSCSSTTPEGGSAPTTTKGVTPEPAVAPRWEAPPSVFSQGVASGDPGSDRVILWTRLAADPLASGGGLDAVDRDVAFDVALDDSFADLVVSGIATAPATLGHSVHLDVTDLEPDTEYVYRFRTGDQVSPVGRTRTLPSAESDPGEFRFAFATCQDYQWGRYGAWARAIEEPELRAVVFLGDYIYETTLGDLSPDQSASRVWAGPEPRSLDEYRRRYAQTRSDPQLQAAHAALPWIVTWDDHEVSNNYAGDVEETGLSDEATHERRLAGHQAFYEYMPIRIEPTPSDFGALALHRSFTIGSLAEMFVIETRAFADTPPCRDTASALLDQGPGCAERDDPTRTNLGSDQETWLLDGLRSAPGQWTILANPLMFSGLNLGTPDAPEYPLDTWDGYPAVRTKVLQAMEENASSSPVVITGDWHAGFVLEAENAAGSVVAPEFIVTSVTTVAFETDYGANNPHQRYFHGGHGYAVATVTPERFTCEFVYVDDVWDPDTAVTERDVWFVENGTPTAVSG
jgi:alkaline phosphatase D